MADESSELAPLAARALLLDVARAGETLIAVGDHGNIVLSRDEGRTWQQSLAPTRALLTAVSFPDAQHGWIVGHDGVILTTTDGGLTWRRQNEGESRETIFLDVLFLDIHHGFAVGAYGKFLATSDGGQTWTSRPPGVDEVHYNRLTTDGTGGLYLAGEAGTVLISTDQGLTWSRRAVPYAGSLFGVLPLPAPSLLTYGLRGRMLRSADRGANWIPVPNPVPVLIMAGLRLKNDRIVLAGQGGHFFISHDAGQTFLPWQTPSLGTSIADLIETTDGHLLTVGEAGAIKIQLP